MGSRWRATASLLLDHVTTKASDFLSPNLPKPLNRSHPLIQTVRGFKFRPFSAIPSRVSVYSNEIESGSHDLALNYPLGPKEDEETGKIPVKAYFLCTSINLKSMQAENLSNVVPPTSRSTNYTVLRFFNFSSDTSALGIGGYVSCRYMVVFQYGSAVLFNIEDHEVERYLEIVRRHTSGLLSEMRKDDYAIIEKPLLAEDMQGGLDYIVLKTLDNDSIRIIGSVLGQSIALDYFVSQVDGMVEEFSGINRAMEKTGTFTMGRKKLLQLVGKANSNLADVILKVGLFERCSIVTIAYVKPCAVRKFQSEIAWRDAKYAQIYEYLREEYEVNQRFGSLDYKLKFVEHNIHFLQEVIQNRRSDLLEWCIIFLLSIENIISIYEIVQG
ncbi:sad1-interacting factor 2-like [Populus alba x Populus x berolinensis]|uniref:Sad1-interacting factor 2-like n=1 Tax=Populus alba x Populus x berolinensis TaxID=444605 RepID=A0AAD6ML88_9ROSI|nr:sad1-interacting factor 2-like [Populus alba x Populus x berolinensis]